MSDSSRKNSLSLVRFIHDRLQRKSSNKGEVRKIESESPYRGVPSQSSPISSSIQSPYQPPPPQTLSPPINESKTSSDLSTSALYLTCSICFLDVELQQMLELERCFHLFCHDCLRSHCSSQQSDGNSNVPCPQIGCTKTITPQEIKLVLGQDAFRVFDRRALEEVVTLDPTLFLCSSPDCSFVCSWNGLEDGPPRMLCPLCQCDRCLLCNCEPFHVGFTCQQHEEQKEITKKEQAQKEQAKKEQEKEEERLTKSFISKTGIKICPRCKNGVVKESGCDKLKCRCGYRSCWVCGSENAQCPCTPSYHGYIDNVTGQGDFSKLYSKISPT
jgi:hypothetical protein